MSCKKYDVQMTITDIIENKSEKKKKKQYFKTHYEII